MFVVSQAGVTLGIPAEPLWQVTVEQVSAGLVPEAVSVEA